ncbi:MAG TPA: sigma-54 dependent transcriptional regulator [Thermodesulfobacteriota bacterium]|jgi:DNA-binding NtrC family response regulator|nr:sigma-54 dependent transcriptional regulator [Thermodesulfobacteriota bacterium]
MTNKRYRILVVDDDLEMCGLLSDVLSQEGFSALTISQSLEASKTIKKEEFDVIVTDLRMKGLKGLDLLEEAKRVAPLTPVIIITAFGTIESAIQAMKMGAYDYITKPFQMDEFVLTVKKALENRLLKKEVVRLRKEVESRYHFHHLIGKSPSMQSIYGLIERIGDSTSNVLITGESGTGKELVARAIHYNGIRKEGPFIPINCAAIPETLLESELFGYKRGAFTDAKTDKKGLMVEAAEGTIFLDEVTEMSPLFQAKLLRVIEEREVRPLGDTNSYPIDVRIISASNRDIENLIHQGRFREDLYFRMKVIDIELPPLRERREDIPLLADHFINQFGNKPNRKISGVSEEALRILINYSWPGNVRELENIIQRAIALCRHEVILPEDLPSSMLREPDEESLLEKGLHKKYTLDQLEKEYIKKVLIDAGGNKSKAAEILGLDRKTLYRKIEEI